MVNLLDEVSDRELSELVSDGLFTVLSESAEPLLDRLCSLFDTQGVLYHLLGDSRNVRRFPSKDILVCPKEDDERAFLFVTELCPDQGHLGWIG